MVKRPMLLLALAVACAGCGGMRNEVSKMRASVTTLDYTITLYAANGDTIQTWRTRAKVESNGGEAWWVDDSAHDYVQHHISGTFTVEGR